MHPNIVVAYSHGPLTPQEHYSSVPPPVAWPQQQGGQQCREDHRYETGAVWAEPYSIGTGAMWAEAHSKGEGVVWAAANHYGAGAAWTVEFRRMECRSGQSQKVEEPTRVDRFHQLSTDKRRLAANSRSSGLSSSSRI